MCACVRWYDSCLGLSKQQLNKKTIWNQGRAQAGAIWVTWVMSATTKAVAINLLERIRISTVMSMLRPLLLLVLLLHCVSSVPLPGVVKSIVEPGVPDVGVTGGEPVGNYERKTQVGRDYTWSRSCAIFGLLMVLIFLCLCRRPLCGVQLHFLWLRLRGRPALS